MVSLVSGLILFFAVHLLPTAPSLRTALRARLGENGYKLAFSLASALGLGLIVVGVSAMRGAAADVQLWYPPIWARHLAFTLMLPAFVLVVAAYTPSHIRDWARHPMLAGVTLWAAAHLAANGDLLALLLFGSFLLFSLYDRISASRREVPPRPAARGWAADGAAVLVGVGLWAATLLWLHAWAGVPLLAFAR
ncbi:NnrU family protein [Rhodoblastus sp.]|uniref:NnrU family protein n=1 Tax=Rhodoblastus sp. TaxID=1962975 RepID=UPI0035B3154C